MAENKGIPIDNDHVSKDPNKSPKGADQDATIPNQKNENYVEPYAKKKYQEDPKNNH